MGRKVGQQIWRSKDTLQNIDIAAAAFSSGTNFVSFFIGTNVLNTKRFVEIENAVWKLYEAQKVRSFPITNECEQAYVDFVNAGSILFRATTSAGMLGFYTEDQICLSYGNNLRGVPGSPGQSLYIFSAVEKAVRSFQEYTKGL